MASYGCSDSDVNVLRRSHSHNMIKQRTVVVEEPYAKAKSETVAMNDVDSAPMTVVEVQVKKEKTDDEHHSGIDVSRPINFLYEAQISLKGNSPRLPKDTHFAAVKEERRDKRSSSHDTKDTREVRGAEKDFKEIKESADRRKTDVSIADNKIHDDSKQTNKKRKVYELYAEEHSIRNDLKKFHPTSHARYLEAPIWNQVKEGERKMPQDPKTIDYTQFINKTYADPYPTYERVGIHEMPSDYHVVAGTGCKLGPIANNDQVHKSSAFLPPIDPRDRKCFITEEPSARYVPGKQTYISLQEERFPRWHPTYGVLFANPNRSECFSQNAESKSFKQSEEDGGFQSKERFERHHNYRLQADSNWPHFDQIAGKDNIYDKQRIAFLRVEYPGAEKNSQTKAFDAFSTEQHPGNRPSTGEYVRYLPVPNMLIPPPKAEFLFNGLRNVPFDIRRPYPVTDNGNLAFIEKEKVFYPCCNEEMPPIHYNNVTSNARWLDTRNVRQRFDEFQASKSGVPLTNQTQTMVLDDAGAGIIHMNDLGCKQKRSRRERERFKDVPLPAHATVMEHEFSKKKFSSEETIKAEKHTRRINEVRRKDKIFSSYSAHDPERKANGEKPTAWKDKVDESRSCKDILEGKNYDATKEERNEESGESGIKLIAVSQVKKEKTKTLKDPKNSETQLKISLDQAADNQDDSNSKKAIFCSVCKKTFNRTSNLYTHMRTHSANKPHACEFCGKRFHQKADLRIHRYIHTGEKPHKCAKCGRGFKQLTHLKYHMRTHSDVRMYKCQYCEKGFNQKSNLQAHIFGHTGQRPHKCETCGKGFTLASTLNTHKRIHLPNKPFKCEFCDRAFYQKNALKMHYVSTHPYSSGVCLV